MSKLITFPKGLKETNNWLFEMNGRTNEKNSSGGTGSSAPGTNAFQTERGSSFIASSGVAVHGSMNSGWKMMYNTSIDASRWFSSSIGFCPYNSDDIRSMRYSPLYDGICNGFQFKYKKFDQAAQDGQTRNRFRAAKLLMVYRNGNTGYYLRDCPFTGGAYFNFSNFVTGSSSTDKGHFSGTISCSCPTLPHPIGMVCQLQSEGGVGGKSNSYITIYDLEFYSSQTKEAIMLPFKEYYYTTKDDPQPMWTT